jgi:membrane peptidoglycan carboxypeptidase
MVGSKDYFGDPEPAGCQPGLNCRFEPNVNVALSQRQPGSSGKPYIYATAFKPEFKQSPASLRVDVVTDFGTYGNRDYIPHNYSNNENGPVSVRKALAGSLNIPAVKTLDLVGVNNAVQTMHDFGITSPLQNCGLSLVLGGCEVRLIDHVAGYSTIATEGIHHPTTGILKIQDSSGTVLEEFQDQPQQVLDPQSAYELINILTDNDARTFIFGAHSPLTLSDRPVAAKTGTTQNYHDGWTLGFTPSLAAGVWAGNNDGTLLRNGADGVVVAGPIWHNFMQQALAGTPPEGFAEPDGIQHVVVDSLSGLLPTQYTPSTKNEVFASFSVPTTYDNVHVLVTTTDPQTGQTSQSVCAAIHSEKPDNASWEQPVQNWVAAHPNEGYCAPGTTGQPGQAGAGLQGSQQNGQQLQGSSNNNTNSQTTAAASTPVGNPPTVKILYPFESATLAVPIMLQAVAVADSGNSIIRADLLIDGTFYQSLNTSPYNFEISQIAAGTHTLAVHVVDDKNNSADTSVNIKIK